MKRTVSLRVNGQEEKLHVEDADTLLEVLRDQLRLWSVREGCGVGACGTCTVLMNGRAVSSCFLLAVRVEGCDIVTAEGLSQGETLDPTQQAFIDQRGLQCGYCTPGFVLAVKALLNENPDPTDDQAREYLAGNLCRCGGYEDILRAVRASKASRK
jgi:carbon-monoxide dehydrogenase small subunit